MIAWHRLKFGKGLPRVMLQMAKATIADAQERKVRAKVSQRDGLRCFLPGCRRRPTDLAHIKARSLGGLFVSANLVRACRKCHQMHHAGLIELRGNPDRKTLRVTLTSLGRLAGLRLPGKVA